MQLIFCSRYYDLRSEVELELEQEFLAIQETKTEKQTFYHGCKIENDHKNRYKNIIPCKCLYFFRCTRVPGFSRSSVLTADN